MRRYKLNLIAMVGVSIATVIGAFVNIWCVPVGLLAEALIICKAINNEKLGGNNYEIYGRKFSVFRC